MLNSHMTNKFENMTKEEALKYCYKNRNQYIADGFEGGNDGVEQFDCLISIIESGTITPSQLPEYGMDYEEDEDSLS